MSKTRAGEEKQQKGVEGTKPDMGGSSWAAFLPHEGMMEVPT